MATHPSCSQCEYHREYSAMAPEEATEDDRWCSNSKSPNFRTVMPDDGSCEQFTQRGEQAPDYLVRLNKIFGSDKGHK